MGTRQRPVPLVGARARGTRVRRRAGGWRSVLIYENLIHETLIHETLIRETATQ